MTEITFVGLIFFSLYVKEQILDNQRTLVLNQSKFLKTSSPHFHPPFKSIQLLNCYSTGITIQLSCKWIKQLKIKTNKKKPTLQTPEEITPSAALTQVLWHFLHTAPKMPPSCHQ